MYLLIKLINELSNPNLTEDEWRLLADIYASLEEKKFAAFEAAFLRIYPATAHITIFMQSWFAIRRELAELNSFIPGDLNEETRAAILCHFLPPSIQLLTLFAKKIEWLARVSTQHNQTNDLLRFFLKAITMKVDSLKDSHLLPKNFALLQPIIDNIYKKLLIKKLNQLCTEYINSIAVNIENYLNDHDEICILYYSRNGKKIDIHQLIREENEAIERFHTHHTAITPMFNLLRTKYIMTQDLRDILNGTMKEWIEKEFHITSEYDEENHRGPTKKTEKIMIETQTSDIDLILNTFSACFEDYKKTFQIRVSYPDVFFGHHYTDKKLEDNFLKTCTEIKEKITSLTMTYRR